MVRAPAPHWHHGIPRHPRGSAVLQPDPNPRRCWHFCFFNIKQLFGSFCPEHPRTVTRLHQWVQQHPVGLQPPPGSGCWAVPPPRHVLAPPDMFSPKIFWGSSRGKPRCCVPAAHRILRPQEAPGRSHFPLSPARPHPPPAPASQELYPIPCKHGRGGRTAAVTHPHPLRTPKPSPHAGREPLRQPLAPDGRPRPAEPVL